VSFSELLGMSAIAQASLIRDGQVSSVELIRQTLDRIHELNPRYSVDASARIKLIDRDVPSYFKSLEHLLRYFARPPFALERLSVIRGEDGRIACVRYVLPRHKATNWVGPGRGRKSTRPGANGVVELSPCDFLARLADLVPPPRKHRHRPPI
jgi:hypothetical protein